MSCAQCLVVVVQVDQIVDLCVCVERVSVSWVGMNDRPSSSSSGDAGAAPPGPSPAAAEGGGGGGGGWAMVQDSNGPAGPDTIQHHDQSPFVTHSSHRNSSGQYHHNNHHHHHQHNSLHVYHQPHLIKGLLSVRLTPCLSLPPIPPSKGPGKMKKKKTRRLLVCYYYYRCSL